VLASLAALFSRCSLPSLLASLAARFARCCRYLWQFPHFFALSFLYRKDYAAGGFEMVPVNDSPPFDRTASLVSRYSVYLATLPLLSCAFDLTSPMFAVEGLALNGYALYVAHKFNRERTNANARKVFTTSLW
jgi:heme O synthase-like polyprenyltransferase